ncbi:MULTISPECIES: hypothetical protein [unclassified Methylobacterium]|uniref:hypothetical protein n=1 Tax=unclassified Methylobacterium TaxID=2615210 RepID=UPI00226A9FF5|nr:MULTISPECIES: hypothetical protein [unclassified Methylobacterium]
MAESNNRIPRIAVVVKMHDAIDLDMSLIMPVEELAESLKRAGITHLVPLRS